MFSYYLPKFAALHVNLPTGGSAILVHKGDGCFVSKVPPIAFAGVSPEPAETVEGLPVGWDGSTLKGDGQAHAVSFVFDVAGAQAAVEAAAAEGDTYAQAVVNELVQVEKMLQARAALGVMDPVDELSAPAAGDAGSVQ